ncbi:MAG: S41 family peptidase [Bdellovibrionales bacterium]|nr:S41 family peptidase [Bdellovibrionales bacterium]
MKNKNASWTKIIVISAGFVLVLGAMSLSSGGRAFAKERYTELQLFTKVLNLVQQYYVEETDTKKLIYGAIKGMLKELDPHTNFLPPEIFKEFESETSGEFGGLGVEITVQKGVLTVISPIDDAPAFVAGIKSGDRIVSINGESTKGWSLVEAAQKMRGSNGSKVILGIYRDGFEKPKDFTVVRGTVKIHSVKYTDLEDGYAYVRLTSFIENSSKDFSKKINEHIKKHKSVKGLVLDLRRNPGGLLDQAVAMSDFFLDKGIIVSTMDRNKKEKQTMYAKSENTLEKFPLVVLMDEYSASASEILAGALQDNKRALIMGQRSFGKGSVQSVVKLGDGSGLKLTVARYYTPSGRSIQAEGIAPDVVVDNLNTDVIEKALKNDQIRREKDISGHLEAESTEMDDSDADSVASKQQNKSNTKSGFMQMWWGGNGSGNEQEKSSPKVKLLKEDFQVLQAYNYLRAWKVMKGFEENKPEVKKADVTSEAKIKK